MLSDFLTVVAIVLAAWFVLALVVGLIVGRGIKLADDAAAPTNAEESSVLG